MSEKKIANFLKQLRKTSGYSANEVVEKLKLYNIDISAKTLYGYESGLSMPNADAFISLCRIYKCENSMDIFGGFSLKPDEVSLVEKYRALDQHGQETVDIVLDRETARVNALSEQYARIKKYTDLISEYRESSLNAAHERTDTVPTPEDQAHDDAIMDDDSEWE